MESVHYFVRGLFRGMPETGRITEQREEIEAHISDRISDAMAHGVSQEEAFHQVVESLGNLDELIETMTGEKKKILIGKANWYMMALGLAYGSLYIASIIFWYYLRGSLLIGVSVCIPAWLGYALPAGFSLFEWRRRPGATEVVPLNMGRDVRLALTGWLLISAACWAVNLLLAKQISFMSVLWAWMPTAGVFTWPLMTMFQAWSRRRLKSIEIIDTL